MTWKRLAEQRLVDLSKEFPAVVVEGARQVGKTTLARAAFSGAAYKDLESPLVRQRFAEDPTHELGQLGAMTILDEAQAVPELFPALRGVIDARRVDGQCHFCILGSAQPALIQAVSESLAGRIGLLELDPLMAAETGLPLATHWLAGGFPEALRGNFRNWWEPYLSTILQRDLAAYGFRPDAVFLRRLLTMLATQQGGLLNMSALGSSLGVSHHTVEHGLNLLEGVFLIRRLPPFFRNIHRLGFFRRFALKHTLILSLNILACMPALAENDALEVVPGVEELVLKALGRGAGRARHRLRSRRHIIGLFRLWWIPYLCTWHWVRDRLGLPMRPPPRLGLI